jgi:hypothetical protein
MGYIYLIRNKINNLCYIGQTRQNDVNLRWLEHKSNLDKKRGCPLLTEASKKNNINRDTISLYCKNKKELKGFIWKFNKD